MFRPIIVLPYDSRWQERFRVLALAIRSEMGDVAKRIDHVGSTSIPNIAAKPIIDIQISVTDFEPFDPILKPLESLGYRWREYNEAKTRRYFREPENHDEVHIHVRRLGSWSEQLNLLFRDYLRRHEEDRNRYAALKLELAEKFCDNRSAYVKGKDKLIWEILRRAHDWTWETGWVAGESDI